MVQKRAIRAVCNTDFRAHTSPLFYEHNILKLEDVYLHQLGSLMYNFHAGQLPLALAKLFHRNNQIHNYSTRNASALRIPHARTMFAQKTLICTGPKIRNSLNSNITSSVSISVFKRKMKPYLLNKYLNDS